MKPTLLLIGALAAALAFGACLFRPDLSAYASCGADGACPEGTSCWPEEGRCLPLCGEQTAEACALLLADGGIIDPGSDGGGEDPPDGGDSDGGTHGSEDGGTTAEGDGGTGDDDGGLDPPDAGPLRLDAVQLPPAVELEPYAQGLSARGGTAPYLYTLVEGTLPEGLALTEEPLAALDPAGPFTGAPTETGLFSFTLRATDSATPSASDDAPLSLLVVPLLRISSPFNLPDADSGQPYTEQLMATGGSGAAWIWSVSAGHSPPGSLSLASDGTLSGSTSQAGTFEVTLIDPGSGQQTRKKQVRVEVNGLPLTLHIRTRELPEARLGEPFDYRLLSGGGTGAHAWSIQSGSLPDGITLQGDRLRGTPSTRGTSQVTLRVQDSLNVVHSRAFSLTVH